MKSVISYVYKVDFGYDIVDLSKFENEYQIVLWKPGLTQIIPQGFSKKYILYWIFHYLGIFKNKFYCAVLVYSGGNLISKMIVTPAYFKFPFMEQNDLQFTYSVTESSFRGQGINTHVKFFVMQKFQFEKVNFIGVVDPENISSIRVLTKLGMTFRFQVKRFFYLNNLPFYFLDKF